MAHPFHHALSSSRKFGGVASDYQAIHDWFDQTKSIFGNFRHRALRHHVEGVALAVSLFGSAVKNSDGIEVSVEAVGLQHVVEDCGRVVTASDWLSGLTDLGRLTPKSVSSEQQAENSASKSGGSAADYLPIHRFLDQYDNGGPGFAALRHHTWGLFDAEHLFGAVIKLSNGVSMPIRYVGEQHLLAEFGRLPSPVDFLEKIPAEKWMLSAAGPAAREIAAYSKSLVA
jgi:hypothetical protein